MSLPEFNLTYFYSALFEGYKYWLYRSFVDYATLTPLKSLPDRKPLQSFIVEIDDLDIKSMACGEDDFTFFFKTKT